MPLAFMMSSFRMRSLAVTATLLLFLITCSDAYRKSSFSYRQSTDTSSGYCKIDGKDEIPVGGEDFDDESCEKTSCGEGYYELQRCSEEADVNPHSNTVRKSGNFPTCCEIDYNNSNAE